MLQALKDHAEWIVAVSAGAGALGLVVRNLRRRARAFFQKFDSAADALIGRDAIVHPDTGEILVPATPGLGKRLADIEATLARLADIDAKIVTLELRVTKLENPTL